MNASKPLPPGVRSIGELALRVTERAKILSEMAFMLAAAKHIDLDDDPRCVQLLVESQKFDRAWILDCTTPARVLAAQLRKTGVTIDVAS